MINEYEPQLYNLYKIMSFISLDISTTADELIAQAKLCGHVQQSRLESSQTKMKVKNLLISYNVICCFEIRS